MDWLSRTCEVLLTGNLRRRLSSDVKNKGHLRLLITLVYHGLLGVGPPILDYQLKFILDQAYTVLGPLPDDLIATFYVDASTSFTIVIHA